MARGARAPREAVEAVRSIRTDRDGDSAVAGHAPGLSKPWTRRRRRAPRPDLGSTGRPVEVRGRSDRPSWPAALAAL